MGAYQLVFERDCSTPCEQVDPNLGSRIDAEQDALLAAYSLCDVCGMDGSRRHGAIATMQQCGCCLQHGRETPACHAFVDFDEKQWVNADPEHRHWRCKHCR